MPKSCPVILSCPARASPHHSAVFGDPSVGPFGLARYGHMSTVWSAGDDKHKTAPNQVNHAYRPIIPMV
jgi:hypothetical protein